MLDYRLAVQERDGDWSMRTFQSACDPDAISYVLKNRTSAKFELFQGDRWIATFDGEGDADDAKWNGAGCAETEDEIAYFQRRAEEERMFAWGATEAASTAHLRMAEYFTSLGRAVRAQQRRRQFYDVNKAKADPPRAHGNARARVEIERMACCEAALSGPSR